MEPKDLQPPNFICTINFSGSQDFQCHRSHNYTASNLVINTCINTYLLDNKENKSTEADKYLLSWTVTHKIINNVTMSVLMEKLAYYLFFSLPWPKQNKQTRKEEEEKITGNEVQLSEGVLIMHVPTTYTYLHHRQRTTNEETFPCSWTT